MLTSLVGVVLVGIFAYRINTNEFDRFRLENIKSEIVTEIEEYYQIAGNWDEIRLWIQESPIQRNSKKYHQPRMPFAITSPDGEVLIAGEDYKEGDFVPPDELANGDLIVVDDEAVGVLLLSFPPDLDPRERDYLDRTTIALVAGGIGAGSIALVVGILLSRQFLRPLTELTGAIQKMRSGNYNQQVRVYSQDELGALANTFNQMSAELHRANQLRKQMTADIAHDLRTPLTVISGYLEGLKDGSLSPTAERFETLFQETQLLKRLIDDLRTLSLADAGELSLMVQWVAPIDLLEQVRASFVQLAEAQDVKLIIHVHENLPAIEIDRERMAQVLGNLLSNSLRYTPSGGTITLSARMQDDKLRLTVHDSGQGIPAEQLSNIFERFYRVGKSRYQEDGESGLGLAIAKSLVEAHQGTISAESEIGRGTIMTIFLPLITSHV